MQSQTHETTPAIRPFRINVPEEDLADLRRRIAATGWPEKETVTDASQGVQLATMQRTRALLGDRLRLAQVRGEAERPAAVHDRDRRAGHSFHSRSFETCTNALPLIVTHGWPGSIIEQLKIIDPLTNPTAHGGSAVGRLRCRDSVVAGPRLFRQADHDRLGPDPHRARLDRADEAPRLHALCGARRRLGECGHGADGPAGASGIARHSHQHACHRPDDIAKALQFGGPAPSGLSADEQHAYDQLDFFYKHGLGYAQEMGEPPADAVRASTDSPVGLAAWMLDHDARSYALIARVFDGQPEGLTRDDILDNVTLYWLTNTAVSSARLYWESKLPFSPRKASPSRSP